jgi:hypothetical protein
MRFSKGLFQKIKRKKNNLELDSEESDKLCILPDYFNVKNFTLKTSKVVDYLNLNENNNFFLFNKNIRKLKNKFDFHENCTLIVSCLFCGKVNEKSRCVISRVRNKIIIISANVCIIEVQKKVRQPVVIGNAAPDAVDGQRLTVNFS